MYSTRYHRPGKGDVKIHEMSKCVFLQHRLLLQVQLVFKTKTHRYRAAISFFLAYNVFVALFHCTEMIHQKYRAQDFSIM